MAFSSDATWADRTAKAVLLIRILSVGFSFPKAFRNFFFPIPGSWAFREDRHPWPQVMAPFVGVVEIVCGALLLVGLITRLASIPL